MYNRSDVLPRWDVEIVGTKQEVLATLRKAVDALEQFSTAPVDLYHAKLTSNPFSKE